jgi:MFS family permease
MPSRVAFMLRALQYRNYRLFFGGQIVSLIGSWITLTATSWLVYRLTGSALLLGVVGFAGQFPGFVVGPFAGAYVDRWDRHKLLVWTQAISMVQSFALAALTLTGHITVGAIVALNAIQGIVNSFDMPARQAFLVNMITDKEDLANAIALNSSMFNAARLIGPSIAGLIIAASSEGLCFLIDGISYFAVLIALVLMRDIRQLHRTPDGVSVIEWAERLKAEGGRLKAEGKWISVEIEIVNETERKIVYDDSGA